MEELPESLKAEKVFRSEKELRDERSEWEAEWRQINENLLPGRGIFQTYNAPRKRKLTNNNVINSVGEDALYILTSNMHGRLTSPTLPWFSLKWAEESLNGVTPLVEWLQNSEKLLHAALHESNFYSMINSFYIEYAGFGTACTYVGEDTESDFVPFRFELLTAGEFSFSMDVTQTPNPFSRTIFMSQRKLVEHFPETASEEVRRNVSENREGIDKTNVTVLEYIIKENHRDKKYTRVFYEVKSPNSQRKSEDQEPLQIDGFYEFPYPVARWGTIGSDTYGIGPGSRALPDIKRLQEMEKSFLMATHKAINPPLNAPTRMKGKVSSLPGGVNYYANPNEKVGSIYERQLFDYQGVSAAVERVEERIQRNFYNDVFLTASRDPNASPLKATQVIAQDQEKLFRLGPVVERLQFEYFIPVINRCFNIMRRKDMLPELPPELEDLAGDFNVELISPMAVAQKAVKAQGTDAFMAFLGSAAQFSPEILDNVDPDSAAVQRAEIEGVDLGILRSREEVEKIRRERAEAQKAQQEKEEAAAAQQIGTEAELKEAQAGKTRAEAGLTLVETQREAGDAGIR